MLLSVCWPRMTDWNIPFLPDLNIFLILPQHPAHWWPWVGLGRFQHEGKKRILLGKRSWCWWNRFCPLRSTVVILLLSYPNPPYPIGILGPSRLFSRSLNDLVCSWTPSTGDMKRGSDIRQRASESLCSAFSGSSCILHSHSSTYSPSSVVLVFTGFCNSPSSSCFFSTECCNSFTVWLVAAWFIVFSLFL